MEQAIIVLVVAGFLMFAAEVFVPGLVLGILGGICLLTSVVLCYMAFGPLAGTAAFAGLGVLTITGFLIWLKIFSHTPIGRKIMLKKSLVPENSAPVASLLGKVGVALTPLRPSGTARILDRRVDVVAESNFIEIGESVTVIFQEGLRVVVRRQATSGTPEKQD
ncbi:MAG: NfeD family protein [Terrimicrobiaceae bacterium]